MLNSSLRITAYSIQMNGKGQHTQWAMICRIKSVQMVDAKIPVHFSRLRKHWRNHWHPFKRLQALSQQLNKHARSSQNSINWWIPFLFSIQVWVFYFVDDKEKIHRISDDSISTHTLRTHQNTHINLREADNNNSINEIKLEMSLKKFTPMTMMM